MKPFDFNKYLKNNPLLKESVEESFKDRIAAKKTASSVPSKDMMVIYDAIKQEVGNDYSVKYDNGSILMSTEGPEMITISQDPGNKAITVALDGSGEEGNRFNPADIEGIMDEITNLLYQ